MQQASHPQTLGYALTDSPVGLLSWIYDKIQDGSDEKPDLDSTPANTSGCCWTKEDVITWTCLYWFSTAGAEASLRIYYESAHSERAASNFGDLFRQYIANVKLGISYFPKEVLSSPRVWARSKGEVVFEKEWDHGGHFAAWESPAQLVRDVREMFGKGGGAYGVIQDRNGY